MSKPKLLFVNTPTKFFISHRLQLARAASEQYEVFVSAEDSAAAEQIKKNGFTPCLSKFKRSLRLNPFRELVALISLYKAIKRIQPDIINCVGLKSIIYGSICSKFLKIPSVYMFTGLGIAFSSPKLTHRILKFIIIRVLRFSLYRGANYTAVFQNKSDMKLLSEQQVVEPTKSKQIKGSGVDTKIYQNTPEIDRPVLKVLFVGRLLWAKGVGVFLDVAKKAQENQMPLEFLIAGEPDDMNKDSVPKKILLEHHDSGLINYLGFVTDMVSLYQDVNIVVMPTMYGEGIPKAIIEACSCQRAVIASNIGGCVELIKHQQNGLLVSPSDKDELYEAIDKIADNPGLRARLAQEARQTVVDQFSIEIVISQTLPLYDKLVVDKTADT